MTPTFETSGAGIAIAVVFAVAMGGLMLWMFRVPRPVTAAVATARHALDTARAILVPTTGSPYSRRGVELACRLAQEHQAEIILVYVIEVPRTLPLNMPLERAEADARDALNTARQVVELHNLPVRTVIRRARQAADGIIAAAREHGADIIVLGLGSRRDRVHGWGRTAEELLHRAEAEVIFDRVPD